MSFIDLSKEENYSTRYVSTNYNEDINIERVKIGTCSCCLMPIFNDSNYETNILLKIEDKNYEELNITILKCEVCTSPECYNEDRDFIGCGEEN